MSGRGWSGGGVGDSFREYHVFSTLPNRLVQILGPLEPTKFMVSFLFVNISHPVISIY